MGQEEDEGENAVTTAECLSVVLLQEAVAQEKNDCGHLA